jgi:translation elongation factor EF-Tu-like GTPase
MKRRTIVAKFRLLTADAGGRAEPLISGYRSLLRFEAMETDFGFEITVTPSQSPAGIAPGFAGIGTLSFWTVDQLPAMFREQKFEMREGTRIVGSGEVVDPS